MSIGTDTDRAKKSHTSSNNLEEISNDSLKVDRESSRAAGIVSSVIVDITENAISAASAVVNQALDYSTSINLDEIGSNLRKVTRESSKAAEIVSSVIVGITENAISAASAVVNQSLDSSTEEEVEEFLDEFSEVLDAIETTAEIQNITDKNNETEKQCSLEWIESPKMVGDFLYVAHNFLLDMRNLPIDATIDLRFEETLMFLLEQEISQLEENLNLAEETNSGGSNGGSGKVGQTTFDFPEDDEELLAQFIKKLEVSLQTSDETNKFLTNIDKYLAELPEVKNVLYSKGVKEPWWIQALKSIENFSAMALILVESLSQKAEDAMEQTAYKWKNFWQMYTEKFSKFIGKSVANEIKADLENSVADVISQVPTSVINQSFNAPVGCVSVGENNEVDIQQNIDSNLKKNEIESGKTAENIKTPHVFIEEIAVLKPLYESSKMLSSEKHLEVVEYLDELVDEMSLSRKPRRIKATVIALWELCKNEPETLVEIEKLANILKIQLPD